MGSPPTIDRVGGLIRNKDNLFKLRSCSLVHFYNSKVSTEGGKEKPAVPAGKLLFWFHRYSFFRLAWREPKKWWNRKFCAWNRPISTILADSICGIIWERSSQKSRAQKMSGGAAGGGAAQNANSDEARTA